MLYGALSPTGDHYDVELADPIALDDPDTRLEMSLGISYSFQTGGIQQFSQIDVNGNRLTTSAGGEDDGMARNGGLITVGGRGDSVANPSNPTSRPNHPRSDDELYDLRPFVDNGDTNVQVATSNPSRDDNVFLATFVMNPPVTRVDQVAQALDRLAAKGLTAADVDLVTVGMGGNDAKFGDIVAACLLPNVLRELVKAYPDAPGEVEFIVNQFATCSNADKYLFKTDAAIAELEAKEKWAQKELVSIFGAARIMQFNYPNVLPAREGAADWCGGIRKDDLPYANEKISHIDNIIGDSVGQAPGAYELVDVESLFGQNALCPSDAEVTLANGIGEDAFRAELDRLLNIDGEGDAVARGLLDDLVVEYNAYKGCLAEHYNPFGGDCDTGAAMAELQATGQELLAYLQSEQDVLMANLVEPPDQGSDAAVRFDRSRGLFHPNANGFAVLACKVLAQYHGESSEDCLSETSPVSDTVNGAPIENEPEEATLGDILRVLLRGFASRRPVLVTAYSEPTPLGSVLADDAGIVATDLVLPDLNPGVHTIVFSGETAAGTSLRKTVRVEYPGRPSGDTYATYLCCFDLPAGESPDPVTVSYLGEEVMDLVPDEDGGVLVEVPLLNLPFGPFEHEIVVRSEKTGEMLTEVIRPVPSVTGIWVTGSAADAFSVSGNDASVEGLVHSDGGVVIAGHAPRLPHGVEFATELRVGGSDPVVGPTRQMEPGGLPPAARLADYRPDGDLAHERAGEYHGVPALACVDGVWRVDADQVPEGLVYVPCGVAVTGPGVAGATIAAEGPVTVSSRSVTIVPPRGFDPAVVSGGDVAVSGRDVTLGGAVVARSGAVSLSGRKPAVRCGIVAQRVAMSGTAATVTVDEGCQLQ